MSKQIEAMKLALETLEANRRTHNYCEDAWYSCPKHEDGCANEAEGDDCNCGADSANAEIDKAITALREALAEQPAQQSAERGEPVGDEWTPCMKLPVVVHVRKQRPGESHVSTREGITPVKPDDLIMRGVSGEEYPIGRAIFEQTYSLDNTPQPPAQP